MNTIRIVRLARDLAGSGPRRPVAGRLLLLAAALFGAGAVAPVAAQQGPPPHVRAAIQRLVGFLESEGDAAVARYAEEGLAAGYRARFDPGTLEDHLRAVRAGARGHTDNVSVELTPGDTLELVLAAGVRLRLKLDGEGAVVHLGSPTVATAPTAPGSAGAAAPAGGLAVFANVDLAWGDLPAAFERAAAAGFSGAVLVRRGGREVVRGSYGLANPGTGTPMRTETVFGIGSTPIDFTVALTHLLAARGALRLDDPVARYLDGVPADKASLSIAHILAGRSGLPDFHDTAADWDADLAWIDRDTAVRRILRQPLLFVPGEREAHSHSAYGLLAAVLEHASGQTYQELVRAELLGPLGMTRTGFYGESLGLPLEAFAVGHGEESVGVPNIPPNWGPASWLVMGSGGMFSTLDDLAAFYDAARRGVLADVLADTHFARPWTGIGGSMRGFQVFTAWTPDDTMLLVLTNTDSPPRTGRPGIRALAELARGGG